jgi:hypothetical protein
MTWPWSSNLCFIHEGTSRKQCIGRTYHGSLLVLCNVKNFSIHTRIEAHHPATVYMVAVPAIYEQEDLQSTS